MGLVKLLSGENHILAHYIREYKESEGRSNLNFMNSHFINKVLDATRNQIVARIVTEIKENGGFFGVEMDTSQDISSKDQCAIAIRYLEDTFILERTVIFLQNKDSSGKGLFSLLESALNNIGLLVESIVSFSFDGAANMRFGLTRCIQEVNPKSFYTWCFSHRLNLVIKGAKKLFFRIKVICSLADETAVFVKSSYKRSDKWTEIATQTPNYNSLTRLKMIGQTRWSSERNSIKNIAQTELHLFVLIKTLIRIACSTSSEGLALATCCNLLSSWLDYENILLIVILNKIFTILDVTTKYLQTCGLHILEAINSIKRLHSGLDKLKSELPIMFEEAESFIGKVNTSLASDNYIQSLNMNDSVQIVKSEDYDENLVLDMLKDYITNMQDGLHTNFIMEFDPTTPILKEIPFLDLHYLKYFLEKNPKEAICLKELCEINNITNEAETIDELYNFANYYWSSSTTSRDKCEQRTIKKNETRATTSLPLLIESESDLDSDQEDLLDIQDVIFNKCFCMHCIMKHLKIQNLKTKSFDNIFKIYKYTALLPCTEVKCESVFSNLKITKNRLRTNVTEANLQNLIILSSESDLLHKIKIQDIIHALSKESVNLTNQLL